MRRLAKAVAALGLVGLSFSAIPLADPADAHVPGGGPHHLSNCTQWVIGSGRPYQPGDGPGDGCVAVIQTWLNQVRFLRILSRQPVPPQWTQLVIDGDWGSNTSAATIAFQDNYRIRITGVADATTMLRMWDQCLDISEAQGRLLPACDHV